MKTHSSKSGFSIIIAMGISLLGTLIVLYLLEYMIPFSKNVKGIESATSAYYFANSAIEDSLYFVTNSSVGVSTSTGVLSTGTGYLYTVVSTGTILPEPGYGNSEFDSDWSILAPGDPVQVLLPNGISKINFGNAKIYLRVPNFDNDDGTIDGIDTSALSGTTDVVNWQISSTTDVLNSQSGSRFHGDTSDIYDSTGSTTPSGISFNSLSGFKLDNSSQYADDFYDNSCNIINYSCVLKLSIVHELIGQNGLLPADRGKKIPYLEYKVDFNTSSVPSNVIRMEVMGKAYGFEKSFDIYYPRDTLVEAYDFTIFQ